MSIVQIGPEHRLVIKEPGVPIEARRLAGRNPFADPVEVAGCIRLRCPHCLNVAVRFGYVGAGVRGTQLLCDTCGFERQSVMADFSSLGACVEDLAEQLDALRRDVPAEMIPADIPWEPQADTAATLHTLLHPSEVANLQRRGKPVPPWVRTCHLGRQYVCALGDGRPAPKPPKEGELPLCEDCQELQRRMHHIQYGMALLDTDRLVKLVTDAPEMEQAQ